MTSYYVVMQNDAPIAVMRERCSRKFYSFIKSHAIENKVKSVPIYKPNCRNYCCQNYQGHSVFYTQTEVPFIN